MSRLFALLLAAVLLSASALPAVAQTTDPSPIDVVTWNIGLDDADLETVGNRLASFDGVDLWGAAGGQQPRGAGRAGQCRRHGRGW